MPEHDTAFTLQAIEPNMTSTSRKYYNTRNGHNWRFQHRDRHGFSPAKKIAIYDREKYKWKEIFQTLEDTLDKYDNIGKLFARLRIKYI